MTHNLNKGVKNCRSVSFDVRENKENCLKNTAKSQVNVQQLQKDCDFMTHLSLLVLSRTCTAYVQVYLLALFSDPHLDLAIDATARWSRTVSREARHTQLCTCKGVYNLGVHSQFLISEEPKE